MIANIPLHELISYYFFHFKKKSFFESLFSKSTIFYRTIAFLVKIKECVKYIPKKICRILPLSHDIPVYLLTKWNTNQMFTILNRCVYFHNISLVPKTVPSKCPFFKDIMSPSAILSVRRETILQHITWTFQTRDLAYRISSLILPGNKYEIFFLFFVIITL